MFLPEHSISGLDTMLAAVRVRINELQVNSANFEEFAGLPRGYLSKLVGVNPTRRIHMLSMGPLFGALGLRGRFVEDQEATERLKNRRLPPRNGSYARPTHTYVIVTDRKWAQIQKLGHQARRAIWGKLTPQQRSDMMRALTLKRWRRLSKKQRSELMRALVLKRWHEAPPVLQASRQTPLRRRARRPGA
jgi:hypothetical protein